MSAEWEQTFRTKIKRTPLTKAEKSVLGEELDRTAHRLREIGLYDAGPRALALAVVTGGKLVSCGLIN